MSKVRVRIAPSPTGPLHIGTARTALFNYLFAKKHGGSFVLRIEDTDLDRSDSKWEKDILENLLWLGIKWDEGPIANAQIQNSKLKIENDNAKSEIKDYKGGYGPYRQSERLETYAKYLEKLLNNGLAYHCFCTEEELEAMKQEQMSRGEAPKYSGRCRQLSESEAKIRLAEGVKSVIRFRVAEKKIEFQDLIRGKIEFDAGLIGDIAIAKNLATPLYNFAVVIDDFEMEITHVIRGEDHISNTPKQILLQEALEFPRPHYAHLPLILGSDRSKLSKRHGAVSVGEYKKEGYLPEALVNFMAFLGWNPGTKKEIYSTEELIKDFSMDNIQKGGAIFNIERLNYLNGAYIRQKPLDELAELCLLYLPKSDFAYTKKVVALYQERLKKLSEITELTDFFFQDVLKYDNGFDKLTTRELLRWKDMTDEEIIEVLDELEKALSKIESKKFTKNNLEKVIMPLAEGRGSAFAPLSGATAGKDRGKLLWPFRVALTGKKASAGPFEIAEVLGKEKAVNRIRDAKKKILETIP